MVTALDTVASAPVLLPKAKLGAGNEAAAVVAATVDLATVPKLNAGVPSVLFASAVVATVAADEVVDVAVETSLGLSPKANAGTGNVDFAVELASVVAESAPPVKLNVTVEFLLPPILAFVCSTTDGGDEMVPIENGVEVVEVTEVNVAADVPLPLSLSFSCPRV